MVEQLKTRDSVRVEYARVELRCTLESASELLDWATSCRAEKSRGENNDNLQ